MRLILALLLATTAYGQTITGLKVADDKDGNPDLGPNGVTFVYTVSGVSGATAFAIDTGTTTSLGETLNDESWSADGTYYRYITHATASETRYYQISVGATVGTCPVTCSPCSSSDNAFFGDNSSGHSGLTCTNGEPPRLTHPAAGTRTPTAPTHADTNPYDDCNADGTPTSTTCANLLADLTTLAGTSGTHQVELAVASTCALTAALQLPALTTATRICIRPELADGDLRPTDFSQVDFGMRDQMMRFRYTGSRLRVSDSAGQGEIINIPSGYTITDAVIEDNPLPQTPTQATVSSYSGTALTLSATCPAEFVYGAIVMLNMPGLTAYPAVAEVNSCSGTTLNLLSGTLTGTLSGTGKATLGPVPITTCNASSPIQCDVDATDAFPTGSYTLYDRLNVLHVNGQTGANGRWAWSVIDSNTIELTGTTSVGAFTSSPYALVRIDGGYVHSTIKAQNTSNVHLGRVIVRPSDIGGVGLGNVVSFYGADGAILRDSIVSGSSRNCSIGSDGETDCHLEGSRTGSYVRMDGGDDIQIINNLLYGVNATAPLEANDQLDPLDNITISRNHIIGTDRSAPDIQADYYPNSFDLYGEVRHGIELKSGCYNCAITYNYIRNCAYGQNNNVGSCIVLNNTKAGTSPTGIYRVRDADVSWNWFDGAGSPFATGTQQTPGTQNSGFFNRVRFSNNFVFGKGYELRTSPRVAGAGQSGLVGEITGMQINNRTGGQYMTWEDNTFYASTGSYAGTVVVYQADKAPACLVEGNAFLFHRSASLDEGFVGFGPGYSPTATTTNLTEFDNWCPGGSFAGNLIVAGVEDPTAVSTKKSSSDTADTITAAELSSLWPTSGSFSTLNIGPSDSTYAARHAAVFDPTGATISPYTAFGVSDMAALRRGVFGEVRSLDATYCGGGTGSCPTPSLIFTWTAPTTTGCTVRLTDDSWTTASSQTDASSSYSQTVTFTGVGTGAHEAWIECPNGKPLYWAKTL